MTISADNRSIVYKAPLEGIGNDVFTYTITDAGVLTSTATVTVNVTNAPPTIDLDVTASPPVPGIDVIDLTFATPTIINDGQTEALNGVGNGETAIYSNVGTVNGQSIDMRAVVVSSASINPTFGVIGDDANVGIAAALDTVSSAEIRWEVVLSGTDTPVSGDISFLIADIDTNTAFASRYEQISVNADELDGYSLNGSTAVTATQVGSVITFTTKNSITTFCYINGVISAISINNIPGESSEKSE